MCTIFRIFEAGLVILDILNVFSQPMKVQYTIGTNEAYDFIISGDSYPDLFATIDFINENWVLTNQQAGEDIFVNSKEILASKILDKYDIIKVADKTIHWCNYLYEGDEQDLYARDIFSFRGRMSRANFRALSLLVLGLSFCIVALPSFLASIIQRKRGSSEELIEIVQFISPYIYFGSYSILGLFLFSISTKRIRDTGHSLWKLLIPFYNLKLLFGHKSKLD